MGLSLYGRGMGIPFNRCLKAFNEMDQTVMLWNVRYELPSGARLVFNTCKKWVALVIQTSDDNGETLHGKQGVTQGDLMASNVYTVGLMPLIRKHKDDFTSVYQPWFVDYAGAAAKFKLIHAMFTRLQELTPYYG
jgi:hypothetical protein